MFCAHLFVPLQGNCKRLSTKTMEKENYDIFVSYRRTSYDTANLIAVKLRHAGYKVFFDVDTLTAGKFNEQLLEVIKGCKDFVLVLPEGALDRCHDEGDWIRREVMCAIENNKNIIPVMLDGFSWPKEFPQGMEELPNYQAVAAVNREYFDMSIQRLQSYLKSKPQSQWGKKIAIALAVLLVLTGIGFGVVWHIVDVTCESIGTRESAGMNTMSLVESDRRDLQEALSAFYSAMDEAKDEQQRKKAEKALLKANDAVKKNLASYRKAFPAPEFKFNSVESYILAYYNIKQEELNAYTITYENLYDTLEGICRSVDEMVKEGAYTPIEQTQLNLNISCLGHFLNSFYYGYLGEMSLLPKSARKAHFGLARKWIQFPNGTPLDLSQEEYEGFQMKEMAMCEEEINNSQK